MTDERYLFMQDLKEKNSTKSGAYHKRSGKRSHYVGLPSDHLSPAELKRRNGPLKTYNINTCIRTFAEFKELPADLKKAYVLGCRNTYGARIPELAAAMGVHPTSVRKNLIDSGVSIGRGGRYKLDSEEWEDFVDGYLNLKREYIGPEPPVIPAPATEAKPTLPIVIEEPVLIAKPPINPYRCTISLCGTPGQLADLIAVLTDRETVYDFSVTINGKEV